MDLLLNNLISRHILAPAPGQADTLPLSEIHHIEIFEPGETCLESLMPQTLLFFPLGTPRQLDREKLKHLWNTGSVIALHREDYEEDRLRITQCPLYLLPDTVSLSSAIARCYELAYTELHQLAEASVKTMDRLSRQLVHHKGGGENIINAAMELMECPMAYATSDMHLQLPQGQSQDYLVVNPLYIESHFNWELAIKDFHIASAPFHACLAAGLGGAKLGGYLYQNDYCQNQGCKIFIFPVTDASYCYGYLFLSLDERYNTLSPERGVKIQQILSILKFEIIKSDEIAHTVNRYYDFLLDELIESDQTDFKKLMQKYGLVQKIVYDDYYVLIVGRNPRNTPDASFHELLTSQQFNYLYDRLVHVLGTIQFFLFERKDYIVTLLPQELAGNAREGLASVLATYSEFFGEQYLGAGISDVVPVKDVRQGYLQALKAYAISSRTRDKSPCFYGELGVLRFFFDRSNQVDFTPLLALYQEYILPITDYDRQHGGELLTTLTAYITYRCSPSAICQALYIHKNTLYSRLDKISQILGKSLGDSETIFNLSLGLKVLTLVQAGIIRKDLDP